MNDTPIRNVSDTALMAAAYRAVESDRPDALFRDPLAARLAGKKGRKILESLPSKAFVGGWTVVIRTRIIDDFIHDAIVEGVNTVVNLGAGLDTRPYRMELPASLRWIEVDQPQLIDLKEAELATEKPQCRLERVKLDLSDVGARRAFLKKIGSDSGETLVLTEAVTPYLSETDVAALGKDLRDMESVSGWIVDYFSPASYEYRRRSGLSRAMANAPFLFEPADYFGFFSRCGWSAKEVRYLAEGAESLGRPAPFPVLIRALMRILGPLASPERRREMRHYAGIVFFKKK
jgi:methyltransferase (TIGR00027 family)